MVVALPTGAVGGSGADPVGGCGWSPVIVAVAIECTIVMATLASVLLLLILLLVPGMMGVGMQTRGK